MKQALSFFTKENVTFLIAIIGLFLSLYNFFLELLQNRMKLRVVYKNHSISELDCMGLTIALSIENRVKTSISISRIFLNIGDNSLEFYWVPQFVYRATQTVRGKVCDEINIHTLALPTHIEGHGVVGGFFYTKSPEVLTDMMLISSPTSLTIHSNKGIKTYPILMNNTELER